MEGLATKGKAVKTGLELLKLNGKTNVDLVKNTIKFIKKINRITTRKISTSLDLALWKKIAQKLPLFLFVNTLTNFSSNFSFIQEVCLYSLGFFKNFKESFQIKNLQIS